MTSQIDITLPVFGEPTTQSVRDNFTTAANEISNLQQQTAGAPFLPLAGGRLEGAIYLHNDPTDAMMPATKAYVDAGGSGGGGGITEAPADGSTYGRNDGAWQTVLPMLGGTLLGALILAADPTVALGAVTKQYADAINARIIVDAPSDGASYARRNAAWATVLPMTGGVLSGNLGINVAIPTAPAPAANLLAPAVSTNFVGFNAYVSASQTNYLSTGFAGLVQINQGQGRLYFGIAASAAAGTALSISKAAYMDVAGNFQLAGGAIIPSDSNYTILSSYGVALAGHLAFNCYIPTPGTNWKALMAGYSGNMYVDVSGAGTMNFVLYPSTAAGGALNTPTASMSLTQAGRFQAAGAVVSANGRIMAQANAAPSVTTYNTQAGTCTGFWNDGTGINFGGFDGNGNATTYWVNISQGGLLNVAVNGINMYGGLSIARQYATDFTMWIDGGSLTRYLQFVTSYYFNCQGSGQLFWNTAGGWGAVFQTNKDFQIQGLGYRPGGGAWADSSDIRTKEVTAEYTQGLAAIVALRPVVYRKKGNEVIGRDAPPPPPPIPDDLDEAPPVAESRTFGDLIGLVAQECELVMPEMVSLTEGIIEGEPVDDLRILDASALPFALVNAVKEIDARLRAGGL